MFWQNDGTIKNYNTNYSRKLLSYIKIANTQLYVRKSCRRYIAYDMKGFKKHFKSNELVQIL